MTTNISTTLGGTVISRLVIEPYEQRKPAP